MHKEFLRTILDTAEIEQFLQGNAVEKIGEWMAKPQLILAAIIWSKILWRYKGLDETLDGNLLLEFNEVAGHGI